ncbi:hypothetical protein LCGC14_2084800 [marine sediment metagenome]|uniref:Uncharacterized protein n=1 Tax=marine sediment metagenome TaxID=412755 RepID=A0A0F9HBJ6_9ZZZZ
MFQNKLTRAIFILLFLVISLPMGYYFYSGGESIFPEIPPINTVNMPHTSPTGISTVNPSLDMSQIRHTETPYNDVLLPYSELTATVIPRSTPLDPNRFQEVVFINHTDTLVRIIIISPTYLDKIIEDMLYLDLVYALHWIYIFVGNTVFVESVENDQLYYVNIYEDKVIVGIYRLQP